MMIRFPYLNVVQNYESEGKKALLSEPLLQLFSIAECLFPKNKCKQTNKQTKRIKEVFLHVVPSRFTSMSTTSFLRVSVSYK